MLVQRVFENKYKCLESLNWQFIFTMDPFHLFYFNSLANNNDEVNTHLKQIFKTVIDKPY